MPPFYLSNSIQYSYWFLGCLCALFLVRSCIQNKATNSSLFVPIALILIVLMRLPAIFFNQELNPDESQMIAHAITLKQDPVYWQSADGATTGPLNSYFLALFGVFSSSIDYKLAHTVSLICALLSLLLFYQSVKIFCSKPTSRFVLLAPIFFLSFGQSDQFTHYSSEQLPVVLLNLSLWLASIIYTNNQTKWWVYVTLGFVLAAVPFAKLQASLQALFIGLAVMALLFHRKKRANIFGLVAGALSFLLVTAALLIQFNVIADFLEFYIQGNLVYAANGKEGNIISHFFRLLYGEDFMIYAITIMLFLLPRFGNLKASFDLSLFLFALIWLLIGMYSVSVPSRPFGHYLNLLIYPWALFLLVAIKDIPITNASNWSCIASALIWAFVLILIPNSNPPLANFASNLTQVVPKSKIANKILAHLAPQDRLTVWGWACNYYVETQLAQGTAESHTERCIESSPVKSGHQVRYMSDITKNRPAVFIDAVVSSHFYLNNPQTQSYESFPLLRHFINTNYKLVDTIDGVRIFVLKNRLKK